MTYLASFLEGIITFISSLMLGIVFSLGWAPCMGAFLRPALMLAGQQGHALEGVLVLLAYSAGLGIPFLISALIGKGIVDSSPVYHLQSARNNGVAKSEMAEILTRIAFYAGWPNAWAAFKMTKET